MLLFAQNQTGIFLLSSGIQPEVHNVPASNNSLFALLQKTRGKITDSQDKYQ